MVWLIAKSLTIFLSVVQCQRRCHAKFHDLVHEIIKGNIEWCIFSERRWFLKILLSETTPERPSPSLLPYFFLLSDFGRTPWLSERLKQASKLVLPAWYLNLLRSVPLQIGVQISVSDIALEITRKTCNESSQDPLQTGSVGACTNCMLQIQE